MRRSHRPVVALVTTALLGTAALVSAPAAAATPFPPSDVDLEVYEGTVDAAGVEELRSLGLDAQDLVSEPAPDGGADVEVVLSPDQAAKLADAGVDLEVKQVDGVAASEALALQARAGWDAFRPYASIGGGIKDELYAAAGQYDDIAEIVNVGRSVLGEDILALRVTQNADRVRDGRRPAVMYMGTQHAREWITTEMVRRLMHHVLNSYGTDEQITNLVDTRELWFLPVANPDGYDFTFTEGGENRLWRKNLRDNDRDGQITFRDGVDPNRNFATNWGYDNEGSSPDPVSETYRGPAPNSEPETQALDALFARVGFEFFVNYHSAANLLLYGIGHQVTTPSPDDVIYKALAGDDDNTAIPSYDPDISAELYTTNGDTDTHMQVQYGTLGFTPEMSTCEDAAAVDPDDEWLPEDCASEFSFPDDEELIQQEFDKNIPFAISLAESADDPDDPDSVLGIDAPDLVADPFPVSYGTRQQVAVIGKRSLRNIRAEYSINSARSRTAPVQEWQGGERYGDTHDIWYAEYRATIRANPGDTVEVRFIGRNRGGATASTERFTYTVHEEIGGDVLLFAMEDVTGLSPAQGLTAAQYADEHVSAIEAAGYSADVYDFDVMGRQAPHHLGVLSHYDAVVWETGNDVIPRAQGQVPGTVTREHLEAETSVRDYLNEGGKLLVAGQNALEANRDGYVYKPLEEVPEPGDPAAPECTNMADPTCLALSNDFLQYYLGSYVNVEGGGTDPEGEPYPLEGIGGTAFEGWTGVLNAAGSAQNQTGTQLLLTTSSFLPAAQFPRFASSAVVEFQIAGGPFDPHTGDWYVYSQQADESFKRLSRTVDMTAATTGELSFWTSYDTEFHWDFLFVEARPVGTDDWTTLPDANGHTEQVTGDSCAEGWAHGDEAIHPFLAHYQGEDCSPTGTTGEWHAASDSSQGWVSWSVDLTAYAGQQVELSISYVSDWATQGIGVFLDDVTVTLDGTIVAETSFEEGLGGWSVSGPPEGSIDNSNDWVRTQLGFEEGAVVVTEDTAYAGIGLEGLPPAERNDFVARAVDYLLAGPQP